MCKLINKDKYAEGAKIIKSIPKIVARSGGASEPDPEGRLTPYLSSEEIEIYKLIFYGVLNAEYDILRRQPKILQLVQHGINRQLSSQTYPFVAEIPPSLKSHQLQSFAHHFSGVQLGGSSQQQSNFGVAFASNMQATSEEQSKFIVFVIGGISHQEISALTSFERNQIVNGHWPQERLVMASTESRPLTGREMLKMLSAIEDLDGDSSDNMPPTKVNQQTSLLKVPNNELDFDQESQEDKNDEPSISFN